MQIRIVSRPLKIPSQHQDLCIFGSHTFVPTRWMCKKQTSVPNSSTEAEIVSLDADLRMDGIPALDVLGFSDPNNKTKDAREPR